MIPAIKFPTVMNEEKIFTSLRPFSAFKDVTGKKSPPKCREQGLSDKPNRCSVTEALQEQQTSRFEDYKASDGFVLFFPPTFSRKFEIKKKRKVTLKGIALLNN